MKKTLHPVICIDGPAASGKSTVSRALAQKTGYIYVDSGALYRLVTWLALKNQIATDDVDAMAELVEKYRVTSNLRDGAIVYSVDGVEPGDELRTPEINAHVSPVATIPQVRHNVTQWLRDLRYLGPLVVEGRDIATVVFPEAEASFYLDADVEERARRRHLEDIKKGFTKEDGFEEVKASLQRRDKIDSSRTVAPLAIARGAIVINTTRLTIDEVVESIYSQLPEALR